MNRIKVVVFLSLLLLISGAFALSSRVLAQTENKVYLPIVFKPKPPTYKIAYFSNRAGAGIYIVDANGQDSAPLVVESGITNQWPHWSHDGAHLAFRSKDASNKSSVRVVDSSGGNSVDITAAANFAPAMQIGWMLRWSPDNRELAFYTTGLESDAASDEVFVAKTDGSGVVNVTNTPDDDERFLDWSPDGERIVFTNYKTVGAAVQTSIVSIRPNGQDRQTLYGPIANHALYAPVYSPDGETIAFTEAETDSGTTGRLVLMKPDGSSVRSYQPPYPLWTGLEWSPDSSQLGFIGEDNGVLHAFVVDAGDGSFKKAVVPTDDSAEVTWSADSSGLIYDAPNSTSGARDMYRFDVATSVSTPIVSGSGTEFISQSAYSPVELP